MQPRLERRTSRTGLILALLLCTALVGQQPRHRETTTDLSAAKDYCKSISFPGWHIKSSDPMMKYEDWRGFANMELRATEEVNEYILALRSYLHYYKGIRYSDEKWKFKWNTPYALENVGEANWQIATILNPFEPPHDEPKGYDGYELLRRAEGRSLPLDGHTLTVAGEDWAWAPSGVLLSDDRHHAILQSFTGVYTPTSDRGLGDYYLGAAYVQVYSLKTGREIFRITGTWKGHGISSVFANTRWIGSKMLIVSFDPHYMKDVVLCRLDG